MEKILITYALEEEIGNIQMQGLNVVFCCTGIGKVSTAINVYESVLFEHPDLVLNIGTGGSINRQVGDILICSNFIDRDLFKISSFGVNWRLDFREELKSLGLLAGYKYDGIVSTGDTFQTIQDESGFNGDVFDMEAYAGAQVCRKFGIPYLSIKYVTDIIGQNSIKHWEEKLKDARTGLTEFLKTLNLQNVS